MMASSVNGPEAIRPTAESRKWRVGTGAGQAIAGAAADQRPEEAGQEQQAAERDVASRASRWRTRT